MYQLGLPLAAESFVTMGLLPKGLAMKMLPAEVIAAEGDPNP